MSLLTLDAVTIRSQHYSETSRIVTFCSRERGLIKAIAKGARGPRGRFAASLEPLQRVRVTLSVRPTRDLQTVTQADLLHPYAALREDFFRSAYAQAVVELLARVMGHEQTGEDVYELLLTALGALEEGVGDPQLLFLAFHLHLADRIGYALHLDRCGVCGLDVEGEGLFLLERGCLCCRGCGAGERNASRVTAEAIQTLVGLAGIGAAAAAVQNPDGPTRAQVAGLLRRYLEYHTETDLALRSLQVAESLARYQARGAGGGHVKAARK